MKTQKSTRQGRSNDHSTRAANTRKLESAPADHSGKLYSDVKHAREVLTALQNDHGLNPAFLTIPLPSNLTITDEWKKGHNGEEPTLEEKLGEAFKQARASFEGQAPGTLPAKTLPTESGVVTAPLQSQTDNEQLGEQFAVLNQELKRISNMASGKRRFSEEDARKGFPTFHLWDVLDNSNVDSITRSDWFTHSCLRFGNREGRFDFIGKLTGRSSATAYDIYKERPSRKKRSLH